MNPRDTSATVFTRASVDDGATRNTGSMSASATPSSQSAAASSGVRSGVIAPTPPAVARSRANAALPYRSIGFQYDMTTTAAPVSATCVTVLRTSRTLVPAPSDLSTACWMTGPSINGSEYGSPTSTTSTPASTIARSALTQPSYDGKPAGR